MPRRHLLIGSGPGAMSAAEAIRSQDASAEIVVVGEEPNGYYSRPGLAYYLAKEVPEELLFPFTPQDISRLRIRPVVGRADRIDAAAHTVTLADGSVLPYDRLLIATGSRANRITVAGADLDGVVTLDDMADARELIRRSHETKVAVVVGGGSTALEIVEGLRVRHVSVHYFMRKERYWSNVLSESESSIVETGLRDRGVEIHDFTTLARVVGENGRVVAVEIETGARIPCGLVAVAIGVLPRKDLAQEAGLDCERGILVDRYLRSSDEDIFAAGDVAEVRDALTGRRELEVLWSSAVAKGRVAGLNMATEPTHAYDRGTALNVTRLAGYKITIMGAIGGGEDPDLDGLSRGDSESWRGLGDATVVESRDGGTHLRLALVDGTITGAVVIGDQTISFPLQDLIEARVDVSAIVPRLRAPDAPVAAIIDGAWRDRRTDRA